MKVYVLFLFIASLPCLAEEVIPPEDGMLFTCNRFSPGYKRALECIRGYKANIDDFEKRTPILSAEINESEERLKMREEGLSAVDRTILTLRNSIDIMEDEINGLETYPDVRAELFPGAGSIALSERFSSFRSWETSAQNPPSAAASSRHQVDKWRADLIAQDSARSKLASDIAELNKFLAEKRAMLADFQKWHPHHLWMMNGQCRIQNCGR